MVKVITYGTYDLLHYGHIRLLERAKALGDYLIVGVTADDFDKSRGKLNVQQSLMERVLAVQATGIADEIIVEEYEGQKIDDIQRYNVDIFTVGSDWVGTFDYLNEYCKVVYLDRTQGISSSEIRAKENTRFGVVGYSNMARKFVAECNFVNGVSATDIFAPEGCDEDELRSNGLNICHSYDELLDNVEAIYVISAPDKHYEQVKLALSRGKHVICESPISLSAEQTKELLTIAAENKCVLYEGIKTAYATAFSRLIAIAKSGAVGDIKSVEATCTSLRTEEEIEKGEVLGALDEWGPIAMLPVLELLGTEYTSKELITFKNEKSGLDTFTKVNFRYPQAVASIKVGVGVKSEGELIISGTKGYIYVPAPWWKTEYFETRFENAEANRRYFYSLEGEGIRYEISAFMRAMKNLPNLYVSRKVSVAISTVFEDFHAGRDVVCM
ncbi:MAG: Gfo/Idh/MocA family oxidoreductase [Clostridia bacterium]|nr:Gfo/Idh/MocA family oxidoreductase [Clostridia bacterium]